MKTKIKKLNSGFVALILVIMITSLFIVSSVIMAMLNTSSNLANYHVAEVEEVMYNIDACLSDAMWQITSSTNASGSYSIELGGINCSYQISATALGMKTVTSTATTTSSVGNWNKSVVMLVNVSSSPYLIQSQKDHLTGVCLNDSCYCGDSICNSTETYDNCPTDCEPGQVCGNGAIEGTEHCDDGDTITETQTCGNSVWEQGETDCNADCTAHVILTEACDDGDVLTEACGDSEPQSGGAIYCNLDCTAVVTRNETCDDGNLVTERCGDAIPQALSNYCNSTCTAIYAGGEVCDDGNTVTEACGDGVKQNGTYCNATCSAAVVRVEACDYFGPVCAGGNPQQGAVGCTTKNPWCKTNCSACQALCSM